MIDPVRIEPDAFYDDGALRQLLGLTRTSLATARRSGRLRYTRQGNRTLYKGAWVLAWFDSESDSFSPSIVEGETR